jgi:hypothetical protein
MCVELVLLISSREGMMDVTHVNECGREDDTCTELFDNGGRPNIDGRGRKLHQTHREEHTNRAGDENDEERPDTQGHVIISSLDPARRLAGAATTF